MIDMSASAITERLKTMARMQELQGFVKKGVDMSPGAVTQRLQMQSALSSLCQKLGQAKRVETIK